MKYKYDFEFPIDWEIKQCKKIRNLFIGSATFCAAYTGISLYAFNDNYAKTLMAGSFLAISGVFTVLSASENKKVKELYNSEDFKTAEETRDFLHSSEERDQEIIKMVEKDLEKFEKRKLFKRVK